MNIKKIGRRADERSIFISRYADSEVVSYEININEKRVFITISFDDYVKIQRDILVSAIDSYDKWIDKVVLEINMINKKFKTEGR